MPRVPLLLSSLAAAMACGLASTDRDRDGLDDALESRLAESYLPAIHEYVLAGDHDQCLAPIPRPILFRARPRTTDGRRDLDAVAVTYVLVYDKDCGALGHDSDFEAFTVFLTRDSSRDEWHVAGAAAAAHHGTPAEVRSIGFGRDIWVSRNKHANFATVESCESGEIVADLCAEAGPAPRAVRLMNVGEPDAPMSDDVGDVYPPFRGQRIWQHAAADAGLDLTSQFFLDIRITTPSGFRWEAEISTKDKR